MFYLGDSVPNKFQMADEYLKVDTKKKHAEPKKKEKKKERPEMKKSDIPKPKFTFRPIKPVEVKSPKPEVIDLKVYEKKMIDLLVRRISCEKSLAKLNIHSNKDQKQIIALNFKLRKIDDKLSKLQERSGIDLTKLNTGSRFDRFLNYIKRTFSTVVKKIKKFFKRNIDIILGVASLVLPFIGSIFFKKYIPVQPASCPT